MEPMIEVIESPLRRYEIHPMVRTPEGHLASLDVGIKNIKVEEYWVMSRALVGYDPNWTNHGSFPTEQDARSLVEECVKLDKMDHLLYGESDDHSH